MHEGILIGVGTAVNDNPQLNGVFTLKYAQLVSNVLQSGTSLSQSKIIM
jgi:riboflavin biosynthesis pyrimidine reductase